MPKKKKEKKNKSSTHHMEGKHLTPPQVYYTKYGERRVLSDSVEQKVSQLSDAEVLEACIGST